MNDDRILTLNQEDRFFDLDISALIGENGERIQPECLKILKAVWVNHITPILIGAEFEALPAQNQRFFHLRKKHHAPHGRLGGGGKQRMVAPRIQSDDGGAREAADAIRFQPLARAGLRRIAANRAVKLDG